MVQLTKKQYDDVLNGEKTVKDIANELLSTYTVTELAVTLAELLIERPASTRITVTQDEFNLLTGLFRIKGVKPDGSQETRGRKRKED